MSIQPRVKAFLLCDHAIHAMDGKHSVVGIFQRVHAQDFPVTHHRFGIYIRLGEMRGAYRLTVQFVDPDTEQELAKAVLDGIRHDRPLDDFETSVNLPAISFPHPGTFEVRLFANDDLIHVDTLRAAKVELPRQPGDGGTSPTDGSEPPDGFAPPSDPS
jgi:hypothetical protein